RHSTRQDGRRRSATVCSQMPLTAARRRESRTIRGLISDQSAGSRDDRRPQAVLGAGNSNRTRTVSLVLASGHITCASGGSRRGFESHALHPSTVVTSANAVLRCAGRTRYVSWGPALGQSSGSIGEAFELSHSSRAGASPGSEAFSRTWLGRPG